MGAQVHGGRARKMASQPPKKNLIRRHIRHRLRMPGTLSQHDHRDVQTLSMNRNCGDLRSFCTVAANRRRRFSQRAATVRSRLSPSRRHLCNSHDDHNRDILGNLYGQEHHDDQPLQNDMSRTCTTTQQERRPPSTSNRGISMIF